MKRLYDWMKTNKIMSGVIISTILLLAVNLLLMAQFVNILNSLV